MMNFNFTISREDLNNYIIDTVERTNVLMYIGEIIEVGMLCAIAAFLGKRYFPNQVKEYSIYMVYIVTVSMLIIPIEFLLRKRKYKENFKEEVNKNGLNYFVDNEFTVSIEEDGLHVKDNIKQITYYWDMIEGYHESGNYIYIVDRLGNIIIIIPVNKISIEKSKVIDELEKYTQKSDKLNKKFGILKNALN